MKRLKSLVSRCNKTCSESLEQAAHVCVARTNYDIEIEHWMFVLLGESSNDIGKILDHYSVSREAFKSDVQRVLNKLKNGNGREPNLSPKLTALLRDAWLIASLDFGASTIRSGHILAAILRDDRSYNLPVATLASVDADDLVTNFNMAADGSKEAKEAAETASVSKSGEPEIFSSNKALDKFTIDLTQQARDGKIDPIVGRDEEIRQIVDILCRRRQNNPILTGEAGVGKTAVVEGFARRIAEGDVPPMLKDCLLYTSPSPRD